MKYPANIYAKALAEAVMDPKADKAAVEKNFLALVRKNGDEAHLSSIVRAAERLLWKMAGTRKVTITSARKLEQSGKTLFKELLEKGDVVEEVVDPELVAGVRITVNEELQFDGSLKGKLDRALGSI